MSFNVGPRGNLSKFKSIHETNKCKNTQTNDFNGDAQANSDDSQDEDDSEEISSFYSGKSCFLHSKTHNL